MLGLFNLSQLLTEDKLRELLEKYGKLKSIILIRDRMVHSHTPHHTQQQHSTASRGQPPTVGYSVFRVVLC